MKLRNFGHFLGIFFIMSHSAYAAEFLPQSVSQQVQVPLREVGKGTYRKFGFSIYDATLWSPDGKWNPTKPYVLQLKYTRDLSKDTVVDAVVDGIEEQKVADRETFSRWKGVLQNTLPAVRDGDEIIGVAIPEKESHLFFNGRRIAKIAEKSFSDAFFGIWFGKYADSALRSKLLGQQD